MTKAISLRIPATLHGSPDVSEGLRREIAKRIYLRLRSSGRVRTMSQAAVARMVGVSTVTITKWRAREEALDHLLAVVDALSDPIDLKIGIARH